MTQLGEIMYYVFFQNSLNDAYRVEKRYRSSLELLLTEHV